MDKVKISKVENVTLWRRGVRFEGTLHLTPHHVVFSYTPVPTDNQQQQPPKAREIWIAYPMISFCTYRPAPTASRQQPSIRIRGRDFTFVAFHFLIEAKARDAFDTIRNLTCKLGKVDKLYAFSYHPQGPEKDVNGWDVYDPLREWKRMGVGSGTGSKGWRITNINADYQYSPTYPAILAVPAAVSDNTINHAGKYRSRARIPVLTYLHSVNECSITRSSQPLVGVRGHRSVQDEKLVAAIFSTSKPQSGKLNFPVSPTTSNSTMPSAPPQNSESSLSDTEIVDDRNIKNPRTLAQIQDDSSEASDEGPVIYGATQNNLIVDARPTVNAFAMQAVGLGSENMDHYRFATKAYLGIDNIHVMRDSINKVYEALKDSDVTPLPPNKELLIKSGWLKHISNILDGAALIARQVGIHHSHVLIHCSDGWDRTGQLSALGQLCLDPYYRTLEGYITLVEKDFVSFGHMFRHRSGFLSSEKWFEIENERVGGSRTSEASPFGNNRHGRALENAIMSAKGFFNKNNNDSREDLTESDGELQPFDSPGSGKGSPSNPRITSDERTETKVKETSPVFHQFLDCTYQMLYQYPTRFEFNERFLRRLLYQLYSCQYGTFLYDSEKQRVEAKVRERTRSVWDYFLSRRVEFLNEKYSPVVDDHVKGQERMLFPDCSRVRWWAEAFGRSDDEMNGGPITATENGVGKSALHGIERSDSIVGEDILGSFEGGDSFERAEDANEPANIPSALSGLSIGSDARAFARMTSYQPSKDVEVSMR